MVYNTSLSSLLALPTTCPPLSYENELHLDTPISQSLITISPSTTILLHIPRFSNTQVTDRATSEREARARVGVIRVCLGASAAQRGEKLARANTNG